MKLDPILTKAVRLARRGSYDAAIRTLEPEVNRYHDSFKYYYILGVSCLKVGDFQGALTYFKLARELRIREPNALLGMAVLHLRRGETDRAVDYYLEVQDLDRGNSIARKALAIIRRYAGQNRIADWLDSGEFRKLYPSLPPVPPDPKRLLLGALAVLGLAGLAFSALLLLHVINLPGSRGPRQLLAGTALEREDRERPVESSGVYRYTLTWNRVLEYYDRGLALFSEYRDEAARYYFNYLIESNASESIKNKARLVLSNMEVPGFDTFRRQDNYTYSDVTKDPDYIFLYRGCHVIWQGMAANIQTSSGGTSFNLLVGYITRRSDLEGFTKVEFDRPLLINPEQPLEVLARIVIESTDRGDEILLRGIALHQSGIAVQGEGP
jgi:tetratricopeptide (TPR) repeat protein